MKRSVPETLQSGRIEFAKSVNASREALAKFDRYAELLGEWNQRFNLVAESTLPQIWSRHFLDSAQLMRHIPEGTKSLADLGSGAGFPGLVLSILGVLHVHLIESTGKKANFLRAVIEDLRLDATVHQTRVEDLHDMRFDVLTARALKPLPQLLELSKPLIKKDSLCLFLKGQNLAIELTESAKYWRFDYETFLSLSDRSGSVLKIKNLTAKPGSEKHAARRHRS